MIINNIDTMNSLRASEFKIRKLAKDSLNDNRSLHTSYSKVYLWTNENIDAYLNIVDISSKENALSVLASGDQTFNLITKGIMNIDTFDTNKLTEYFALGLKRALILKYSYKDFLRIINILNSGNFYHYEIINDIIKGLFPYMETNHKYYWQKLIDYDFNFRKETGYNYGLLELFSMREWPVFIKEYNTYLLNEENYNLLRSRIAKANITFKCANANKLDTKFKDKYDLILLSNILDYFMYIFGNLWGSENLIEYEERLTKLSKENVIIFLKYAFFYKFADEQRRENDSSRLFRDSKFNLDKISDHEIYDISRFDKNGSKDAIVLKRIK